MRNWIRFLLTGRLKEPSWDDRVHRARKQAQANLRAHEVHFGSVEADDSYESAQVQVRPTRVRKGPAALKHHLGSGIVAFTAFAVLYAVMQNPTNAYTARYGSPPEKLYQAPAPRLADEDSDFHDSGIKYAVVRGDVTPQIKDLLRMAGLSVVSHTRARHALVISKLGPRPDNGCDHPRLRIVITAPMHQKFDASSTDFKSCRGAGKVIPATFVSEKDTFVKNIKMWARG
jgi:hypothetical protein